MNKYISRYMFYYPVTLLKGERVYSHLKNYRKFQHLSPDAIRVHQRDAAIKIALWAFENSDFYTKLYSNIDIKSIKSIEDFAKLPVIGKEDILNNYATMVTKFSGPVENKTTGGSTGHPVKVAKNVDALARERAATWRAYEWAGVEVGDSQGRFWGVPHSGSGRFKALITDLVANRRRVSAFNLTNESLARYFRELSIFKPKYLYGYVSVIERLAEYIAEHKESLPSVNAVITTSEVLYEASRKKIESAFNVKVFNEYGCGEVGSIAHECSQGNLHIMADNVLIETNARGEIIVTDFYNYKMPLIRYNVGDFGEIAEQVVCGCGVNLPILRNIHGRAYDILRFKDGKSVHPEAAIYVFEDFKKKHDVISQFQILQIGLDDIELNIVPKCEFNEAVGKQLIDEMKKRLGADCRYTLNLVDSIKREKSGKMRVVKSLLNN